MEEFNWLNLNYSRGKCLGNHILYLQTLNKFWTTIAHFFRSLDDSLTEDLLWNIKYHETKISLFEKWLINRIDFSSTRQYKFLAWSFTLRTIWNSKRFLVFASFCFAATTYDPLRYFKHVVPVLCSTLKCIYVRGSEIVESAAPQRCLNCIRRSRFL